MFDIYSADLKVKFRIVDGNGNVIEEQEENIKLKDLIGEQDENVFRSRNKI
jgi:hypothetical protein